MPIRPEDYSSEKRKHRLELIANPPSELGDMPEFSDDMPPEEKMAIMERWCYQLERKRGEIREYMLAVLHESHFVGHWSKLVSDTEAKVLERARSWSQLGDESRSPSNNAQIQIIKHFLKNIKVVTTKSGMCQAGHCCWLGLHGRDNRRCHCSARWWGKRAAI